MAKQAVRRARKILIRRRSEDRQWAVWHPRGRNWHASGPRGGSLRGPSRATPQGGNSRNARRNRADGGDPGVGVLSSRRGRSEGLRRAPDGSAPAGCDFLPQQDIRRIAQLMAVLQEHPRQLAGLPRPMTQVRGKHRAVIEMRAKAVGQISATARTPGQVRAELGPSIAACARDAVGDRVIPAVSVKKRRFLEAERGGPVAIEMEQANALRDDRVIRRDDLQAPGTRRVRLLDHEPHS